MTIPSLAEVAAMAQHVAGRESHGARTQAALLIAGTARDDDSLQSVIAAVEHSRDHDQDVYVQGMQLLLAFLVPPRDGLLDQMAAAHRDGAPPSDEIRELGARATFRESMEFGRMAAAERQDRIRRWGEGETGGQPEGPDPAG